MSEVDIFVYDEQVEAVALAIARFGALHLAEDKALGQWATGGEGEWSGRASQYANQERRILDLMRQLEIEPEPESSPATIDLRGDLTRIEAQLNAIEERVGALREKEANLRRALDRWTLIRHSMDRLAPLWIRLSELRQLEHLHLVAGTIPTENMARLEASLFRIPYSLIPVHRYGDRTLIFAFCAQEHAPILDRALESAFLEPLALPEEFSGTAQETLEELVVEEERDRGKLDSVRAELRAVARESQAMLNEMLACARANRIVAEAISHFGHREHVYLIAGWTPTDRVAELRAIVEAASQGRATFEENPPESFGEQRRVPTLLRNPKVLKGVEGLVTTYGLPGYKEIDPTPLVAVTFVAMFGIMFGDLGHGLVLALAGALIAFRLVPLPMKGAEGIGAILLGCGLSSSLFGVLYGSVFGLEDVFKGLWLQPMNNILTLLLSAIVFGVVVLNIGYACRIVTAIRAGTFSSAIFDKNGITGLALYWTVGALVLLPVLGHKTPGILYVLALLLVVALYLAEPLTNLITGQRPLIHGSRLEFAVQAFFELFETAIGYVSNTLSYVRLGAFAVAHAGLSSVVLILAKMFSSNGHLSAASIIVLVFGNIVVIGFEGLIVGIQTLRLEYYELFGKFFTGEGVPFKPLALPDAQRA
ncbi:MAG: V-type ATPase 116kDa subunit family protein [Anaerolineales bacterium]